MATAELPDRDLPAAAESRAREGLTTREPDVLSELETEFKHTRARVFAMVLRYLAQPRWWVELAIIGGLYAGYSAIRNSVGEVTNSAFANGVDILRLEDDWHMALERPLNDLLVHTRWLADVSSLHYASFHFIVTPAVLIWLYVCHRTQYRRASSILIVTTLLALIGFYLVPTAPPRMLGHQGFVDIMSLTSSWGWWPASGAPGSDAISNQFAAMPSLHCAWATWCGVTVYLLARRNWVRILAACYPFSTFFVVMGTGNHYLLDVIAGLVTLAAGTAIIYALWYAWRRSVLVAEERVRLGQ
ncbi:phosphatase PAP2 family protein [Williamsia sterculiae]|uniref:PAP2 superfamily protein n=1 Tax=Williamsia sterculiae TaxID=1344003 RepID=A0A1N7HB33_9NOCA|nr:phosphatase PAP2 family protein [Williamsia sterculiae]SIS22094.1 PAP2 superfamily protein [Williamsia sterculiae]